MQMMPSGRFVPSGLSIHLPNTAFSLYRPFWTTYKNVQTSWTFNIAFKMISYTSYESSALRTGLLNKQTQGFRRLHCLLMEW